MGESLLWLEEFGGARSERPPSFCDMEHILEYRSQHGRIQLGVSAETGREASPTCWLEGIKGTEVSELGLVFGHSKLATADTQTERLTGR